MIKWKYDDSRNNKKLIYIKYNKKHWMAGGWAP